MRLNDVAGVWFKFQRLEPVHPMNPSRITEISGKIVSERGIQDRKEQFLGSNPVRKLRLQYQSKSKAAV